MVRVRMTKCPNPNRIIEYLQGALPPQAAEQMRQHLLGCSACRARAEAIGLPDASPTVETAVTSFGMGGLTTGWQQSETDPGASRMGGQEGQGARRSVAGRGEVADGTTGCHSWR